MLNDADAAAVVTIAEAASALATAMAGSTRPVVVLDADEPEEAMRRNARRCRNRALPTSPT